MIKRTVSGNVVDGEPPIDKPSELKRWQGRDEWALPIVARGRPEDEFPFELTVTAIDATAAAEMLVEHLVERGEVDGPTVVEVRTRWPVGPWIKVEVAVELTVEAEISAVRVVSEPARRRPGRRINRR